MIETDYVWLKPLAAPPAEAPASRAQAFPFGYISPQVGPAPRGRPACCCPACCAGAAPPCAPPAWGRAAQRKGVIGLGTRWAGKRARGRAAQAPQLEEVMRKMYPAALGPLADVPASGPAPALMRYHEWAKVRLASQWRGPLTVSSCTVCCRAC